MPLLSGLYFHVDDSQHPHCASSQSSQLDAAQFVLSDSDLTWELQLLLCKEQQQMQQMEQMDLGSEFVEVRREAVDWMIRVSSRFDFSELCVVLGAYYFDRFLSGVGVKKGKPWMGQLVAVACLSLAAKMDEVTVPLLVDLQVEGAKYVFEAKTVQRMELLVLSALKWKMTLVTPLSFVDHLIRRFGLNRIHLQFLQMSRSLVASVIADSRSLHYRPSVLAAATMLCVVHEFEPKEFFEYQEQLTDSLKLSKENLDECYNLVTELSMDCDQLRKFYCSAPSSPHGVIDMSFSCENSSESGVASSTVSSPLEPASKRRRIQEQQMRLRLPFNWPGVP